ncbi:hypothetical protein QFC21_002527 [Naganishia friedmannii]|uniref:Uncharacterized protein n=1 Tax=Naganishia friedmannii TaxID=89922 RepID=A0ACC2VUJ4_9TREE|nr:hypothetical protein QFC21_002527 [Naganishia friedmannii]
MADFANHARAKRQKVDREISIPIHYDIRTNPMNQLVTEAHTAHRNFNFCKEMLPASSFRRDGKLFLGREVRVRNFIVDCIELSKTLSMLFPVVSMNYVEQGFACVETFYYRWPSFREVEETDVWNTLDSAINDWFRSKFQIGDQKKLANDLRLFYRLLQQMGAVSPANTLSQEESQNKSLAEGVPTTNSVVVWPTSTASTVLSTPGTSPSASSLDSPPLPNDSTAPLPQASTTAGSVPEGARWGGARQGNGEDGPLARTPLPSVQGPRSYDSETESI